MLESALQGDKFLQLAKSEFMPTVRVIEGNLFGSLKFAMAAT